MSHDVSLVDPIGGKTIDLDSPHQMRGGTYAVGGTTEATLNITYNYSDRLEKVFGAEGIHAIDGMTGAQSLPVLGAAIKLLKDDVDENYWKSTEGNAKRALTQLAALADLRPDGIWKIT